MARLRFLKPLTAYLITRDARRDLDLDQSVIDRVRDTYMAALRIGQ